MINKNKTFTGSLLAVMLILLTMLFGQSVVFAQEEEPPEIDEPGFDEEEEEEPPDIDEPGFDEEEPPSLEGAEPEDTCYFEPTETEYTLGQTFLYDNQMCTCEEDGIICVYEEGPPSLVGTEPEETEEPPTTIISETGPAVGFLVVPSIILGWAYRKKQK
ncbi:hypothetical protein GF366_03570 [Candidatus Peregrinibacteria bacterium]|nr:hypothetical protein [Candidatus Peregrinibacteria bacterium]